MRYRDLLEAQRRFFHTSSDELQPGHILDAGQHEARHISSQFWEREEWLDRYKPQSALPRNQSVFMTTGKPDFMWGDFAYEVEPLAAVERNDMHWFEALMVIDDPEDYGDDDELDEAEQQAAESAQGYWSGRPMSETPWWEYRTGKARIKAALGPTSLAEANAAAWLICELARPEIVRNDNITVYVNPTAQTLRSLFKSSGSRLRAIGFGDDIAVADAYNATHYDISKALRKNAHPMVDLHRMYWEPMVISTYGVTIAGDSYAMPELPEDRWPLALKRIRWLR